MRTIYAVRCELSRRQLGVKLEVRGGTKNASEIKFGEVPGSHVSLGLLPWLERFPTHVMANEVRPSDETGRSVSRLTATVSQRTRKIISVIQSG